MARARNIKPGFFKNELLVEQSAFTRLLFIGLWTLADREGRIEDRPKRIKLELFPYDQDDINACLDTLAEFEFIDRYEAGGKKVIQIVSFLKHQTPHGTEKDSELPGKTGDFTVNERTDKGYVSGVKRAINVKSNGNNVTPPLDNTAGAVNNLVNNALNPESLLLNPESFFLNTESKSPVDCVDDFDHIPLPTNDAERALGQHAVLVKPAKQKAPAFILPDWINEQHWDAWHSCAKRKKATSEQKQMSIDKLSLWRDAGSDYAGALENAAIGGYQGLFLPSNGGGQLPRQNKQEALEARNRQVADEWVHEMQQRSA